MNHRWYCGYGKTAFLLVSFSRDCKKIEAKRIALEPVPSLTIARERQKDRETAEREKSTICTAPGLSIILHCPLSLVRILRRSKDFTTNSTSLPASRQTSKLSSHLVVSRNPIQFGKYGHRIARFDVFERVVTTQKGQQKWYRVSSTRPTLYHLAQNAVIDADGTNRWEHSEREDAQSYTLPGCWICHRCWRENSSGH